MIAPDTPLGQLAALAGVLTSYDDVFGTPHAASEATLRAVLGALHFDVADDVRTEAALRALEAEPWLRGLEPVYVIPALEAARVAFALPATAASRSLIWRLTDEAGAETSGTVLANACPLLESDRIDGVTYERRALPLGAALAAGYYALSLHDGERDRTTRLIVVPEACYVPDAFAAKGVWGLAAQTYALRSARDWGAGDYADLRTLCEIVRGAGGSAVGVNPLHLLPYGGSSPYAPSSRRFVNWALLDVAALPGHLPEDVPRERVARARERDLIDYADLYALKFVTARAAFDRFVATADDDALEAFVAFERAGGAPLRFASIFAALAAELRGDAATDDWRTWPETYRDPASVAIETFASERASDVRFQSYLQWQADEQLARVAQACDGMSVGLYRDLAVGTQLGGLDTWLGNGALSYAAAVGAPPDLLNRSGQDWGVAPFDPLALRAAAYVPFVELVRANVRHAGALRIDHVMGLLRLWWVPSGFAASEGAYVTYRLDELLGVLALESTRARCLVVGEDLGTVPPGFRERLEAARVLSYRVLQFEGDDERFFAPDEYPELALVATGTHDLPTMAAYWNGDDIALRERVGALASGEAVRRERTDRERKRELLREAFAQAGVAFEDGDRVAIAHAANRFLARTPGRLLMVQLEDVLGETEQINMPATTDEHPNWRRRNGIALEALANDERFVRLAAALREERG